MKTSVLVKKSRGREGKGRKRRSGTNVMGRIILLEGEKEGDERRAQESLPARPARRGGSWVLASKS